MPLMKNGLPPFMKRVPFTVRLPGSSGAAGSAGPADVVAHDGIIIPPAIAAAPCRTSRRLGSRMRGFVARGFHSFKPARPVQALARAARPRHARAIMSHARIVRRAVSIVLLFAAGAARAADTPAPLGITV